MGISFKHIGQTKFNYLYKSFEFDHVFRYLFKIFHLRLPLFTTKIWQIVKQIIFFLFTFFLSKINNCYELLQIKFFLLLLDFSDIEKHGAICRP